MPKLNYFSYSRVVIQDSGENKAKYKKKNCVNTNFIFRKSVLEVWERIGSSD